MLIALNENAMNMIKLHLKYLHLMNHFESTKVSIKDVEETQKR